MTTSALAFVHSLPLLKGSPQNGLHNRGSLRSPRSAPVKPTRLSPKCTATSPRPADTASDGVGSIPTFPSNAKPLGEVFDYVIVGAGAAGCVLANRLSADPSKKVLLIESGPASRTFLQRMPLGFPALLNSEVDAALQTDPEPGLAGRRLYFPRGKLVGGSHAISVMLYHRGDRLDYEQWAEAAGASWGPDAVESYFLKSERQHSPALKDSPVHSTEGFLDVSDLRTINPMTSAFVDGALNLGMHSNPDFNDWRRDQEGVGYFQVTQKNGRRATPATTYLDPALERRNLTVKTGITVQRICFGQAADGVPVAEGVLFADDRRRTTVVRAKSEVILAGGVYASPQILMLSGIGPKQQLAEHGISTIVDSQQVGANLQDHPSTIVSYHSHSPFSDKRKSRVYYTEQTGRSLPILASYLLRGRGPLTTPMCEAGVFARTRADLPSCDLQLRFVPFSSMPDPYITFTEFVSGGAYLRNRANRPAGFTIQALAIRPKARGRVELRSSDYRDSVSIRTNWLTDDDDVSTLIEGLKLARTITRSDTMSSFRGQEHCPGDLAVSDDELEKYIRETCHTANAMVGTCAMGTSNDAVVDPRLRVRGVHRLRVIDSSVMPTLPGGQAGAPTMMIAEKGADLILEDAKSGVEAAVATS